MSTLDTTVGGSSSNSFVTLAEFNSYFDDMLFVDDLLPASSDTDTITKLLVMSTKVFNRLMFARSKADTSVGGQALEFPRETLIDWTGNVISSTTIPQQLKDAVCEYALHLYQLNQRDTYDNSDSVDGYSIGGMSIKFSDSSDDLLPKRVAALLEDIGDGVWIENPPVYLVRSL